MAVPGAKYTLTAGRTMTPVPDIDEPGFGFVTISGANPVDRELIVPLAFSWVLDTKVVTSWFPPSVTLELLKKLVP